MIPINRTYAPIQAFVDELVRCGMEHAVTSPGSRNAPLALTLADEERIDAHSVIDERSAGYVALGIAKASGKPVAVTCTSGTAAANLFPAVVEAHESRVPLIVMTADRPPELREVGAGQAIDQIKLYGPFAKWFVEVGSHEASRETAVHFRALACRAYAAAAAGRPGPVHLNFPLREPLAPVREELDASDWEGRADARPWIDAMEALPVADPDTVQWLAGELGRAGSGAIVCGSGPDPRRVATPVVRLAEMLGWPILADPLSGLRCGPHVADGAVVASYDVLLRNQAFVESHPVDLVLRIGDTPTSKPLRDWLGGVRQVVVDPYADWHEPTRVAETAVQSDPAVLCELVVELLHASPPKADTSWRGWREADATVAQALADIPDPFEPKLWNAVAEVAPAESTLWVASSMPIRDVEAFLPVTDKPLRVLANRGANGIDGTVSSALGAALASAERVFLLIGDLALLHDIGGLLSARRLGAELTIVCANNGGGNIFDFLPVASAADAPAYEQHIVTPSGVDLARVAELAGLAHVLASTLDDLRAAVERPGLVEVRTDRARNVELHGEIVSSLERALFGGQ